jgi:hypothetical protein
MPVMTISHLREGAMSRERESERADDLQTLGFV